MVCSILSFGGQYKVVWLDHLPCNEEVMGSSPGQRHSKDKIKMVLSDTKLGASMEQREEGIGSCQA